ncbi:ribonuclease HII [Candidatus Woesearchaeota archaeon]|nr:ribonuclease HII [Candidatus Woesearchaeota archaeon]
MVLICGIDEAGRGCIIGNLVICGVCIPEEEIAQLQELGVKDSKLLRPMQREELFAKIIARVHYHLIEVSPQEIDAAVSKNQLNDLEAMKTVELLAHLRPQKAIVDCPSPNLQAYQRLIHGQLQKQHNHEMEIITAHKADLIYPLVSAASILAKVTRDRAIQKLKQHYGVDFGSGYTSDPLTQQFLQHSHDQYDFVRKSWQTYKHIVQAKEQKSLSEF